MRRWAGIVLAGAALLLFAASQRLPPLRRVDNPIAGEIEQFYVERAFADTATPNLVSAILADYRGYDTFGETTVILTAAVGAMLLLGGARRRGEEGER